MNRSKPDPQHSMQPCITPRPGAASPEAMNMRTLDAYKRAVATRIMQANIESVAGTLPSILESIIMLDLTVDRDGEPVSVGVHASNGPQALKQAALYSVYRARPLPPPSADVLAGALTVSYVETWLFCPDGRFQLHTVADPAFSPAGCYHDGGTTIRTAELA